MYKQFITISSTRLYDHEIGKYSLYCINKDIEIYNTIFRYAYKCYFERYVYRKVLPDDFYRFLAKKYDVYYAFSESVARRANQLFISQRKNYELYKRKLQVKIQKIKKEVRVFSKRLKKALFYKNKIISLFKNHHNLSNDYIYFSLIFNELYLYEVNKLNIFIKNCKYEIKRLNSKIKNFKLRLKRGLKAICFGGKEVMRKLSNTNEDHKYWLNIFKNKRNSYMTFFGNDGDINGNFFFHHFDDNHIIYKRKWNHEISLNFEFKYRNDDRMNIIFHNRSIFNKMRFNHFREYKFRKICYTLVKKDGYFILKASFVVMYETLFYRSYCRNGVIGIDLNTDHIALAETDECGNLIKHKIYRYNLSTLNHYQREHILRNIVKKILKCCVDENKPLVIEQLNFSYDMELYGYHSKMLKKNLTEFMYSQFRDYIISRALKDRISVYLVNPALTSFIGRVKYQSIYKITSHESAALVIARRAMHLKEKIPSNLMSLYKIDKNLPYGRKWVYLYNLKI